MLNITRLKEEMIRNNLNQTQLADKAGVNSGDPDRQGGRLYRVEETET